jgi:hypothetical protein
MLLSVSHLNYPDELHRMLERSVDGSQHLLIHILTHPGVSPLLKVTSLHRRVPVVLDGIVCPARQQCSDLGPLLSVRAMRINDDRVLVRRPALLADVRIQMVVPPLTTLLSDAAGEI